MRSNLKVCQCHLQGICWDIIPNHNKFEFVVWHEQKKKQIASISVVVFCFPIRVKFTFEASCLTGLPQYRRTTIVNFHECFYSQMSVACLLYSHHVSVKLMNILGKIPNLQYTIIYSHTIISFDDSLARVFALFLVQ